MKFVKKSIPFLILVIIFSAPLHVFAQLGDPGCSPDDPCPIDNGVLLLIAVAVGIAVKKVFDSRKDKVTA